MTNPSNDINMQKGAMQKGAYEAMGKGARRSFPDIAGGFTSQIQKALTEHLEHKNIDLTTLSPQERHEVLTKFLETEYTFDKDLLPDNLKRDAIAKENYFLDEILDDATLTGYVDKTQGEVPFARGLIHTTLDKVIALSGLPSAMIDEIKELQSKEPEGTTLNYIDPFRKALQSIIDSYDADKNENTEHPLTKEQKEALMNISINNDDVIETLKTHDLIDEETYTTIKNKAYKDRPEQQKRVWATQLRKQFTYSYADALSGSKETSDSMQGLITVPKIAEVMASYCRALDIDYSEFVDQNKPSIDFSSRNKDEKQQLLSTMVEEYYIPNAQRHAERMGLDINQYKDFVQKLFSLDEKQLTIPGPEGNKIQLSFIDKDINGVLTVHEDGGLGDGPIPFQFTLDASDDEQMQKLAATMPWKKSHTIDNLSYDPQQKLSLEVNDKRIEGYSYKMMHDGEEKYIITQEYVPNKHSNDTLVLTKDGTYIPIKDSKEDNAVILDSKKTQNNEQYKIAKTSPETFMMQPHDVAGLLTAYCLNNSSNLSEEEKAKLFKHEKPPQRKLSKVFEDEILGNDEENKKALEDKEQYDEEMPEQHAQRIEDERKNAYKSWDAIPGFDGVKFERGSQIAIQNVDSIFSEVPGNGGYTMLELTDCDDWNNPTKFKYKVRGGMETDISDENGSSLTGQKSNRLPFSEEWFTKMKDFGGGSIYKFPPKKQEDTLLDYVKKLNFNNQGMDQFKGKMEMLTQDGNTLFNSRKEKIKYFGLESVKYDDNGRDSKVYIMFETSVDGNTVKIKDKAGSYSKQMSLADFSLFIADKGLNAFSQREYDEVLGDIDMKNAKNKKAFFVMSPKNIVDGVAKWRQGTVVDGIKKSNERRVEKVEEIFYTSGITNLLGNIPVYGEYFIQAQDEFDTKLSEKHHKIIMEGDATMNQRGKKLVRGKQTYLDNHELKGEHREACFDKIIGIFEKVEKGGRLDDVERREAFAGLLYVLDKFQTAYPRRLAKYAGRNLRPRLLLNDNKYEAYMRSFNEAKQKLEQGQARGEDVRELMDSVMHFDVKNMSELMKDTYHRYIYGRKSIPVLQEHSEKRKNDTARKDGNDSAAHHPAFARAYLEEVKDKIFNGQYGYAIGALVQLSKRKEIANPQNYRRWLTGVLQVILSGGMKYAANGGDRKYLRDFLRKHGVPISDYILDNAQGGKDLATLLDVISRNSGCDKTFSQATGRNPSLEHYDTRSKPKNDNDPKDRGAHNAFNGKMDGWFLGKGNASKIIPFLENSNLHQNPNLATLANDPSLTDEERAVIARYLDVSLNANSTRDYDDYIGQGDFVNNIIQERTVFNTPKTLVQSEYMNYQKGGFGKNEETAQYFRNAFRDMAQKYASTAPNAMPRESLSLIIKKFYSMFQNQYGGDHQWFLIMLANIKKAKTPKQRRYYARAGISRYIENANYSPIPPMVREALQSIDNILVNHIDGVDDAMVEDLLAFDDISGVHSEKQEAIQVYKDIMHDPEKARRYAPQINDFASDLFAGKIQRQKHFEGLKDDYKSSRKRVFDDDGLMMEAMQDAANQEQEQREQEEAQKEQEEKEQEQEEKERDEQEAKKREEQEEKERQEREDQEKEEGKE